MMTSRASQESSSGVHSRVKFIAGGGGEGNITTVEDANF